MDAVAGTAKLAWQAAAIVATATES